MNAGALTSDTARRRRSKAWLIAPLAAMILVAFFIAHRAPIHAPKASAEPTANAVIGGNSLYQLESTWTDEQGRSIHLSDLRGRVQVVTMMFTHCPSACPTLVREVAALERRLPEDLRARTHFVLVSIDPDRDTPQVLQEYAKKMGLISGRWTLLRGNAEDVRELSATLGFNYGKGEGAEIAHSKLITVLGPTGDIAHQQMGVTDDPDRLIAAIADASKSRS
jgi:protein SCO1/2